jgi:hypothetical protein
MLKQLVVRAVEQASTEVAPSPAPQRLAKRASFVRHTATAAERDRIEQNYRQYEAAVIKLQRFFRVRYRR